jgi:phosphopantothenoylcysteine decarboxylase/phosphopantothenate--cysteine ligase
VLVTAGGTREPIDSVRYIGNRSSGRMGFALADEAARRGAEVTVIAANVALPRNPVVAYEDVATAAELAAACEARFGDCDVLLMAAAVADYRPATPAETKLKKEDAAELDLQLERTADTLVALAAARRPGQTLVGFAAEHGEDAVEVGRGKLDRKGLDVLVVNDISRADIGFDTAENEVTILAAGAERPVPRTSKADVAAAILDAVQQQRSGGEYNFKDGATGASGRPGAARA